jgi:hypothetical protein
MVFLGWKPDSIQFKVLIALGLMLLTMMGFDVIQYVKKRQTDRDLVKIQMESQKDGV